MREIQPGKADNQQRRRETQISVHLGFGVFHPMIVIDPENCNECSVSYCVSARDLSQDAVEDL